MTDTLIALSVVMGFGVVGGFARYLHNIGSHDEAFQTMKCFCHMVEGGFMAVLAGFGTTAMDITGAMQHLLVGLAAMSSRELMTLLPGLFSNFIKKGAGEVS